MAFKLNVQCGPCGYKHVTKSAKKWCANCEEGFCGECEKSHKSMKVTRDHKMISIKDYRQIQDIKVSINCEIHGKKLELYCKKHDTAVCVFCVPSEHKTCSSSDVISIDKASKNPKQSTALSDLEETVAVTLKSLKHCINDQETALKNVDTDEKTIRKTIADTRMNLNKYLDELERKVLLDLKSQHGNSQLKFVKFLNQLKQQEKEIENLREQTLKLKRYATDLQVFLGTRELNKTMNEKIGSLKEEIRDHTNDRIELEIHHVLGVLMKEVGQFGVIKVIETKAGLQLKDGKIDQAQIQIHGSMENAHIAIDYGSDTNRIAVTYPSYKYLEIINNKNNSERKKLNSSNNCWGISYLNKMMYVVVYKEGIVIMDLNGKTLNTIDINVLDMSNITTTKNRIYYTGLGNNTVHCCNMTGQEIWVFKDQSISVRGYISGP
ncbi:unnamed protein product [Mytilus coruscus]|uniref:B box-type domain-containing protein n=1 Tax=Mytilus coruscus TaxID=42192 RepID=A0A6J8ACW9_MYTCO|nr:unnamed protein product [Mytilus coruscus]